MFATTPFALVSPFLIEKLGRRPLFLVMSGLCTFEWFCLAFSQWKVLLGSAIGVIGIAGGNIAFYMGIMNMA